MNKLLCVIGVASVVAGPALAADLPVKAPRAAPLAPVFSWTGWYIGANAGFGWGASTETTVFTNYGFDVVGGPFPNLTPKGFIGGGQIGYDWQATNWVFGLVADFQGADIKDSVTIITPDATKSLSEKLDFLGTVRARLGWAANNWLFYGSGGFAYGDVQSALSFSELPPCACVTASTSETRVGWAAGGGINYAFTPNWIVGVDYLHYDLGHTSISATAADGNFLTISQKVAGDIVRGVINYKF
ncbi:MAG TPA: outer membrane protein [Xanthobacteraceae bacterium]|nr:outer membrane protein [Xanthobacteraceae bacterium]